MARAAAGGVATQSILILVCDSYSMIARISRHSTRPILMLRAPILWQIYIVNTQSMLSLCLMDRAQQYKQIRSVGMDVL